MSDNLDRAMKHNECIDSQCEDCQRLRALLDSVAKEAPWPQIAELSDAAKEWAGNRAMFPSHRLINAIAALQEINERREAQP